MSFSESFALSHRFPVVPAELLNLQGDAGRVPVDPGFYIPLRVFGEQFGRAITAFEWLGNNAVRMTMHDRETGEGVRFGFKAPLKECAVFGELQQSGKEVVRSQQVDGVTLQPADDDLGKWIATTETAQPLTALDKKLFSYGFVLVADHLVPRLWAVERQPEE